MTIKIQFLLLLGQYAFFQALKGEAIVHIFTLSTFKMKQIYIQFFE